MKTPLLSIIVPIYNVEDYLVACIDSILGQTFTDYELILIDDGSTDRCGAICDDSVDKDNRIIVIHQKNGGVGYARNSGLDIARGDYIAFVDSDDEYGTGTVLEDNMNIILSDVTIDIVQFLVLTYFNENKEYYTHDQVDRCVEIKKDLFLNFIDGIITISAWNKIYRRKIFDGLRYPKLVMGEDLYCMALIFERVNKFVISTKGYYKYNQRGNSIVNSPYSENKLVDLIQACLMMYDKALFFSVPNIKLVPQFRSIIRFCDTVNLNYGLVSYTDLIEHVDRIKPPYLSIIRSFSKIGGVQVVKLLIIKTVGFKRYLKFS